MHKRIKTIAVICSIFITIITLFLAFLVNKNEVPDDQQYKQCFTSIYVASADSCWSQNISLEGYHR